MNYKLYLTAALLCIAALLNGKTVSNPLEETRHTGVYNSINIDAPIEVILDELVPAGEVVISSDDRYMPFITTTNDNFSLNISIAKHPKKVQPQVPIIVRVNNDILALKASCSAHIRIAQQIVADNFNLSLNTLSRFEGDIMAGRLTISLTNNSHFSGRLEGSYATMLLDNNSHCIAIGNVANINTSINNASSLMAIELITNEATIDCNATSSAEIYCNLTLNARAQHASTIHWKGDCKTNSEADTTSIIGKQKPNN